MSKISIVVPIYNPGKKLHKCIKSILSQTFTDIEIILVNDGSTDNSPEICRKYMNLDKRVLVINKKNEGSIATRRTGIEASKSNYVMFVDADDWIHKKCVEVMFNETKNSKADIIVCNIYKVLGNSGLIKQKNSSGYFEQDKVFNKNQIKDQLVVAYFHGHPFPSSLYAKLYKREVLLSSGKYLNRIKFLGDDLFYNLEVFLKVNKVAVITKPLYFYRIGGYTSKYMPYLFNDINNGYLIQKEVINEYYKETSEHEYAGISIMLLNTFKTCLFNLFNSNLGCRDIKETIAGYLSEEVILEAVKNEGAIRYFPSEYILAIEKKDVEYLYRLGQKKYIRSIHKKLINTIIRRLAFI